MVGIGEKFRLHHSSPVGKGEKLHETTIGLPVGPLGHDQPADPNPSARMLPQFCDGDVAVPVDLRIQVERMTGGGKPEQLHLVPQFLDPARLLELPGRGFRRGGKHRQLSLPLFLESPVPAPVPKQPRSRGLKPVQRPGAEQGTHGPGIRSDPLQKIDEGIKRPKISFLHDPSGQCVAHIPNHRQRHPDAFGFRKKDVGIGTGNIRRKYGDPQPSALQRVGQPGIETFPVGEDGGKELPGVIPFEDGRLVGLHPIGGGVGPAKGVTLKAEKQAPDLCDFFRSPTFFSGGAGELIPQPLHRDHVLPDQAPAQDVGPAGIQSRKRLADLQHVLLIGDQPEGGAEDRFEGGMETGNGREALIAAGELLFFQFVGGTGADHGDDGDQAVDIPRPAHPVECGHGGTFHVVNAAGAAGTDHPPDLRILPRGEAFEIKAGGWLGR